MLEARALASTEPLPAFEDTAGAGYFQSDAHIQRLVSTICGALTKASGAVVLSGAPAPTAALVARHFEAMRDQGYRATPIRAQADMTFAELVVSYCEVLGLAGDPTGVSVEDAEWTLLTQLMQEARSGVVRVLVVEDANSLPRQTFDELLRFVRIDEPRFMPIILQGSQADVAKLNAALTDVPVVARLTAERLERDEVAPFIEYQLRSRGDKQRGVLLPDTIAAIAAAANGDPVLVNRMVRLALWRAESDDTRRAAPAEPARPTVVWRQEREEAPQRPLPEAARPTGAASSPAGRPSADRPLEPNTTSAAPTRVARRRTSIEAPAEVLSPRKRLPSLGRGVVVGSSLAAMIFAAVAGLLLRPELLGELPQTPAASPPQPAVATTAPTPDQVAEAATASQLPTNPPPATTTTATPPRAIPAPPAASISPALPPIAAVASPHSPSSSIKTYRLQLGALRTAEAAAHEWDLIRRRHPDLLGTFETNVERVDLGERGLYYRLRAGPIADAGQAEHDCAELKRRGQGCIVVKP